MRAPLSWLRDFAPIDRPTGELVDTLNDLGMVVDGVNEVGKGLEGVVVGHVLDVRPHPQADRVRLCDVDLGDGEGIQIACGAPNVAPGQKVPVATIGSVLPDGMEIGRRKLRGEWSNGMICAPDELGLGERHDGIMVLPESLTQGTPFIEAMGIEPDVVFDLDIETNRPDALSIAGIARDVAARLRIPFAIPEHEVPTSSPASSDFVSVEVRSPELCPRFTAQVLTGVRVDDSARLVAHRLTLAGMRPINNVVDASNYVMLELGQPSHPYDLDLLPGRGFIVRTAKPGERLVTLDDVERVLGEGGDDCVICDAEDNVVGVAGVMGGASSEISGSTTNVVLEAAYFTALAIGRTSKRLGLRSEASARFERGTDPEGIERAVQRFCSLLPDATVADAILDVSSYDRGERHVFVRTARVNAILGTELSDGDIRSYLEPIGFEARQLVPGEHDIAIPTFRPDSYREIDVIEEVARHHGFGKVARSVPTTEQVGRLTPYQEDRREAARVMAGLGASEAWTTSLLHPDDFGRAGLDEDGIRITNPMVVEESVLRTSMLPGLLRAVAFNAARRNPSVRLFEIGHVFRHDAEGGEMPDERELLSAVFALDDDDATVAVNAFHVLAEALGVVSTGIRNEQRAGLHPTRCGTLLIDRLEAGSVGEVDPDVLSAHDIERRVGWLEIDLGTLLGAERRAEVMTPVSKFPSSDIDLAFVVSDEVSAIDVEGRLWNDGGTLLESVRLFDVYRGEQLGDGRKSLAYRLRLVAPDRTLTDAEVAEVRQQCIDAVVAAHGAELRG